MKYAWDSLTESQKVKAVQEEIRLVTHNGTTKDDLINMIRWLWDKFEVEDVNKPQNKQCGKAEIVMGKCMGLTWIDGDNDGDNDEPVEMCKECKEFVHYEE